MKRFDGVVYTWIGARYPCCIGIRIKRGQLVRDGLQNCQLQDTERDLFSVSSHTINCSQDNLGQRDVREQTICIVCVSTC